MHPAILFRFKSPFHLPFRQRLDLPALLFLARLHLHSVVNDKMWLKAGREMFFTHSKNAQVSRIADLPGSKRRSRLV